MNPSRPVASPTPSDSRTVCRFCFDSSTPMIRPCKCRGSIVGVHPTCLKTWVTTSGKDVCQMCSTSYFKEKVLKAVKQWTLPQPIFDFSLLIIWMIYMTYVGIQWIRADIYEFRTWMDGHIVFMYWLMLLSYTLYSSLIASTCLIDNWDFEFVDQSTEVERRELNMIEKQPFTCDFCPNRIEKVAPLFWPCACRSNYALYHNECMKSILLWARRQMTFPWAAVFTRVRCVQCKHEIIMKRVAIKKIRDWSWPRPLTKRYFERLNFCATFLCFFSFVRIAFIWLTTSGNEMDYLVFDQAAFVCLLLFWAHSTYYCWFSIHMAKQWIEENSEYRFNNRNLTTERKPETEVKTAIIIG